MRLKIFNSGCYAGYQYFLSRYATCHTARKQIEACKCNYERDFCYVLLLSISIFWLIGAGCFVAQLNAVVFQYPTIGNLLKQSLDVGYFQPWHF